jgi:hypothetical protein
MLQVTFFHTNQSCDGPLTFCCGRMACALKNTYQTKQKNMKQFFTLISSLLLTVSIFAADTRPKAQLTIKSVEQNDIRVIIDGRRFEPNSSYMRIRDMQPGYHNIKIYRERSFGIFTIFGKRYDVVFNSSIFIKPRTSIMMTVDRFGRTAVNENKTAGREYDWDGRDFKNDHDFDFDRGRNDGDYSDSEKGDNKWDRRDDRNDRGGIYNSKAISDADLDRVLANISKERFESNMMKSATQIISTNYFTSEQVKDLLKLFSFESNKLELAKLAYNKTVDQRNYYLINDVFSFSSSKDELARFIRS